jgi:4-amino-4-deoxy-L-arabinose transferase-like glycosyltransferase
MATGPAAESLSERGPGRFSAGGILPLLVIILVALLLRCVALGSVPPGLNQDEAVNAWNAWCLLKTGQDQYEAPWPLFYARMLGENRSAIHLYAILPFQWVGGLGTWTVRLPFALAGVLTVALVYGIGRRLFDRGTGLVAAGLLAVNPWHVHMSRLGLEASLTPLLVALAVWMLLWSGFGKWDTASRVHGWRALLSGVVAGGVCYGYAAVRLFIPLLLVLWAVLAAGRIRRAVRVPDFGRAVAMWLLGFAMIFAPLAYQHSAHPERIAKRAKHIRLWEDAAGVGEAAGRMGARYARHFGPDFLFLRGDRYEIYAPHGVGQFHVYMLPLMLAGAVFVVLGMLGRRAAGDPLSSRMLAAWVVLYPVADVLYRNEIHLPDGSVLDSLHALRSAPGLIGLVLLAAVGAVSVWRLIRPRRSLAVGTLVIAGLVFAGLNARFLTLYFGANNARPAVYHGFHADLVQACDWLRPRYADAHAIFVTATDMNMPYVVTLVGVRYAPEDWFTAPKDVRTFEGYEWEYYFQVGRFHFVHDRTILRIVRELQENDFPERAIFIMRPGEFRLDDPAHVIRGPDGAPLLEIHAVTL